jgi:FkbM family methyltransferase
MQQKRTLTIGPTHTVTCRNPHFKPGALGGAAPAQPETFPALSSWNVNLYELCLRHRVKPRGIIHVGAHWAEEREVYRHLGVGPVLWIEADPASIPQLRANVSSYLGSRVVQACLAEVDDRETTFYRTDNRGESSSILPMGSHAELFQDIHVVEQTTLTTTTFATLVQREGLHLDAYDFLVMDVQGAELLALKGFGEYLKRFNGVYIEVNIGELYQGCARLPDIDAYLRQYGFSRRETLITQRQYGDALYLRDGVYKAPPPDLLQRLQNAARQLLSMRTFIYHRIGHDQRPMELLEHGKIGQGVSPLEQNWLLRIGGHEIVLEFVGSYGRTSVLCQHRDGVWRGGYLIHANIAVELIPSNAMPAQQPVRRGYPYETNIPLDLADTLRNAFELKHFVETGTRLGVTAKTMAPRFEHVYTVELEPNTYNRTRAELAPLKNIHCILGDSSQKLPEILREIDARCMLWLDAHWSGGDTGKGATECPVMEELATIYAHRPDHLVLIDDARLFLAPPPPPHKPLDWPTYTTITDFLNRQTPRPFVRVVGDVIVAGPPETAPIVQAYCRQHGA